MKRKFAPPLLSMGLLVLTGCSDASGPAYGPAANVQVFAGSGQTAEVGKAVPAALVVKITDAAGKAVPGEAISWSASGDGAVSTSVSTTDAAGLAQANYRAGTTAGVQTVTASVPGVGSAQFSVNANPGAADNILLSPTSLALNVGQTGRFTPTVRDQYGNTVTASVSWSSSNTAIARVSDGLVTAVGAGSATISASSGNAVSGAVVQVSTPLATIAVTNRLLRPVRIYNFTTFLGSVDAGGQAAFVQPAGSTVQVTWELVRPTTTEGTSIGEEMGAYFATVNGASGTLSYEIDNEIADQLYFAPIINNNGPVALLMGVNMGLTAESKCNCVVSSGSTNVLIGYYRLYSNSNVRGYGASSNYTGGYIYWENFQSSVASLSGRVELNNTLSPDTRHQGSVSPNVGAPVAGSSGSGVVFRDDRPLPD